MSFLTDLHLKSNFLEIRWAYIQTLLDAEAMLN